MQKNCCDDDGQTEDDQQPADPIYKDVVVVGNGPSAIITSYMLSGHWPYYTGAGHSVDFLHYRLVDHENVSLIQQDLRPLCDGLEGRSTNPVSVLFDHLNHPDADLGISLPSLLRWELHPEKSVDHVVLGTGQPGGSWQAMEGSTLTISLGSWMELPNLTFREWETQLHRDRLSSSILKQNRVIVGKVAEYYNDYVAYQNLDQYFRNHSLVTSVRRIRRDSKNEDHSDQRDPGLWEVCGVQEAKIGQQKPFRYVSPNVILATGSFDCPNVLDVPGEDLPFVIHSLSHLEELIQTKQIGSWSYPIMVVGAGLSAADAIITSHFYGIPIIHVFRRSVTDPNLIFNKLPENMYPEYHKVHQMMQGKGVGYHGYQAYPHYRVVGITPTHKVRLEGPECSGIMQVSYVVVMVGSRPDLSFLPKFGQNLGVDALQPINCRDNPINIDLFSHESVVEPGLFAMGPLVGDNFVRFVQGGALAITSHLHKKLKKKVSAE